MLINWDLLYRNANVAHWYQFLADLSIYLYMHLLKGLLAWTLSCTGLYHMIKYSSRDANSNQMILKSSPCRLLNFFLFSMIEYSCSDANNNQSILTSFHLQTILFFLFSMIKYSSSDTNSNHSISKSFSCRLLKFFSVLND